MAQGATSPSAVAAPAAESAIQSAAPSGQVSPRSGSSFFERLGRRPRTANSNSHNRTTPSSNTPSATTPTTAGPPSGGMPTTFSTESLTSGTSSFARMQQQMPPPTLPRSSSSSNITSSQSAFLLNFPRDIHTSPPATPPAINNSRNPMNSAGATSSTSPNLPNSGGGGPFGRMFRRYSHGAGKNASQDARTGSGSGNTTGATANASSSTQANGPGSPSSGRPSALRSLSNHFLPSSSSLSSRPSGAAESLTRTMSNGLAAVAAGFSAAGLPRSSADTNSAAISAAGGRSAASPAVTGNDAGASASSQQGLSGTQASSGGQAAQDATSGSGPAQAGPSDEAASSANSSQGYRIRLVPHLEASRSLHFEPIERELRDGAPAVKIGRFTERGGAAPAPATSAAGGTASTRDQATSGTAGATLGANARSGSIDVEMAGTVAAAPTTAAASGGGENVTSGAAPSRRQAGGARGAGGVNSLDSARIAFKSKVVSRGHAEIWCENGGNFFLRDTKSSSGTFLNHIRLSAPGVESRPFRIKDGDVIQLGVDYQGGTEEIYRCVKMRIELNRGWQREANQYNVNALRQLRALQGSPMPVTPSGNETDKALGADAAQGATVSAVQQPPTSVTDCCICLFSVTVCQALFIAPCSHVFHYKCIRPLLTMHHPGFSCPLCRTFADLEADVEQDEEWQADLIRQATQGVDAPSASGTPAPVAPAEAMPAPPTFTAVPATTTAPSVPSPLATVPETHSARSSQVLSQDEPQRNAPNDDSAMTNADEATGRRASATRSGTSRPEQADGNREVLQDEDELMEEFEGAEHETGSGNDSASASQPAPEATFSNNAANLSLSASGSLAARRSMSSAATGAPGSSYGPGTHEAAVASEPIPMPGVAAVAPSGSGSAGSSANDSVPSVTAGLEEARTPMNQHFLSTLAESSPGGPAFFNAAAVRAASAASSGTSGRGTFQPSQLGQSSIVPNGQSVDSVTSQEHEGEGEADRSTPEGGHDATTPTTSIPKRDGVENGGEGDSEGVGSSAPNRDEIMSD